MSKTEIANRLAEWYIELLDNTDKPPKMKEQMRYQRQTLAEVAGLLSVEREFDRILMDR